MITTPPILPPGKALALVATGQKYRFPELLLLAVAAATGEKWKARPVGPARRTLLVAPNSECSKLDNLLHLASHPDVDVNLWRLDQNSPGVKNEGLMEAVVRLTLAHRFEVLAFSDLGAFDCGMPAVRLAREMGVAVVFTAEITHCWAGVDEVVEIVGYGPQLVRAEKLRPSKIPAWLA